MNLTPCQRQTCHFGPLWVLSALTGTNRFGPEDLQAFWDGLVAMALGLPEPGRELFTSMVADRSRLLADFAEEDRSVVSGLGHVVAVLTQLEPPLGQQIATGMLRIGISVGRARGPYGRSLTSEDTQRLLLVGQLLELESTHPVGSDQLI